MNYQLIIGAALTSLIVATGCTVNNDETEATGGAGATSETGAGGDGAGTSSGGGGEGEGGEGGAGEGGGTVAETSYVFTMSNASDINELVVFERDEDGSLSLSAMLPTGGLGSGDGLGSQGAITLSPDGQYLYAVNAGSHQISSFRIYDDHLALVDLVASGGERPVSISASNDLVYVLNAAGDGGVQGFSVSDGVLTPGAAQPLSAMATGPAQVGLTPSGDALIVTEKATNNLLTYWVAPDGSLSLPTVSASAGMTPFGFDFSPDGMLVVSEAFGGADNASAASSYTLGSVEPEAVSASVPSGQSAACWLVIARGTFAYTTNTKTNNISGYTLAADGSLNLFDDSGVTADLGADQGPIDMALPSDDEHLYVLNAKSDLLVGFSIADDGSLTPLAESLSVPATSVGLAAR